MQLTKEVLENDRKLYTDNINSMRQVVSYIDGLLMFLDKPEFETPEVILEDVVQTEPEEGVADESIA